MRRRGVEPKNGLVLALLLTSFILLGGVQPHRTATAVFLVRHAEKDTMKIDPPLSAYGRRRAVALARLLRNTKISETYATQYIRTQETVRPLCDSLTIRCSIIETNRDSVERDARSLATAILRHHHGDTVLVCGHSNTIPLIIKAFGVVESVAIADQEYDAIFLVTVPDSGKPALTRQRFGK